MTKLTKAISLGMAAAMLTVGLPNLAVADDDDRERRFHVREFRDHDRRRHREDRHYRKERHYKQHRKERHHRRMERRHHEERVVVHKHKKKKRSYDVLPLLAVVGITAAVLHANAAQAKPKAPDIDWNPAPAPLPQTMAAAQPEPQGPAATCLMTREYQTQIVVNGKLVDGYGHACLQPDGSWYRGPAVAMNY